MRLLLATLAALLALPAVAGAATVEYFSGPDQVRIDAGAGEVNVLVVGVAGEVTTVTDSAGLTAKPPCVQQAPTVVTCPATSRTTVQALLGDGDDIATGGDEDDLLDGGTGTDVLHGGGGDDRLVPGDSGYEGPGDDVDDSEEPIVPVQTFMPDVVDGGDGSDTVAYTGEGDLVIDLPAGIAKPAVRSTDAQATLTGIENATSADGDDELTLGPGGGRLSGHGGDDVLNGSRGDDVLVGGPGEDLIHGAAGDDELSGGRDRDTQYAGRGDDRVSIGPGGDYVDLGAGDDAIVDGLARFDVEYDVVCGPGEDAVARLRPNTPAKGCESILLGGALTMTPTLRRVRAQVWETRIGCPRGFGDEGCAVPDVITLGTSRTGKALGRSTWPRRERGVLFNGRSHVLRFPVSAATDALLRRRHRIQVRVGFHIGADRSPVLRTVG